MVLFLGYEPPVPFDPETYVCYRTGTPLNIDGKIDEDAWRKAPWTRDFQDIEGDKKPKPRFRTRAKMLWDDAYFYVAAEMEEPHVWGTLTKRDSVIFYDNDFEIFIDPDGDTHEYYELEINALNTVWDLFLSKPYRDGCRPMFFWDMRGLKTAVSVQGTLNDPEHEDWGWSVEFALPWAVLKEFAREGKPPSPGDQWRVDFSRVEWRIKIEDGQYKKVEDPKTGKPLPEDNWVWSPQGVVNMHRPETWGFVQFSAIEAGAGVEPFRPDPAEKIKWALRQVYYQQKIHFETKGCYTDRLQDLGMDEWRPEGSPWPPDIRCTWNQFEARLDGVEVENPWHINQEGRVWK
jgi:hypothetical protein